MSTSSWWKIYPYNFMLTLTISLIRAFTRRVDRYRIKRLARLNYRQKQIIIKQSEHITRLKEINEHTENGNVNPGVLITPVSSRELLRDRLEAKHVARPD